MAGIDAIKNQSLYFAATQEAARQKAREASKNSKTATAKKSVFANTGTTLVYVRVDENMYQRRGGKKYYESEKKLQKYMLDNGMISPLLYTSNIAKRYILQVLLPNRVRAFVYQNFARKNR